MSELDTEETLAAAYESGNREALEELIGRFKSCLFGYLLGITGHRDAAEDIFQEVFIKYAMKPSLYKPRQKFRSWLFAVARNAAIDYFRSEKRHTGISLSEESSDETLGFEGSSILKIGANESERPDIQLENSFIGECIAKSFESLSMEQREIFYLRHYSGLSFKEISELTGEPIGTVLARMSRTLSILRSRLAEYGIKDIS